MGPYKNAEQRHLVDYYGNVTVSSDIFETAENTVRFHYYNEMKVSHRYPIYCIIYDFRRTIHALARFGDELYLESLPDSILLRTFNAAESAYAMIKLNKNFFSYFNYDFYSTKNKEALKCKISMRSALNTFKSPTHMDKQVENLEIKLDPEYSKLIFQLKCRHGIVKTHYVSILDSKAMQAVYTKDLVSNRITSSQRIFSDALSNFQNSDDQVTLETTKQLLILRNYVDANMDLSKIIRTQISIKPSEFNNYIVGTETTITFTLKELRAILAYAESLNLPLQLHFETTGKPAVFIIHNTSTFEAHFVLATSKPDTATQVSTENTTRRDKRKQINNASRDSAKKKPNIATDVSQFFDEDPNLFNYINIPEEKDQNVSNYENVNENLCNVSYDIPASRSKSVFNRCFEKTLDPICIDKVILAENSDSD